jgi:hypothetical protein
MATRNGNTDEAARTVRAVTDEVTNAGEQTARAGADIARRGAETARDSLQSGLDTTTETFQRISNQFTRAYRKVCAQVKRGSDWGGLRVGLRTGLPSWGPREIYYAVGWITREAKSGVFRELSLPGGGVVRVMDKGLHMAALESAGKKLEELRHKSGTRESGL